MVKGLSSGCYFTPSYNYIVACRMPQRPAHIFLLIDGGEFMGTCCSAHLVAKVNEYIPNAQNGSVTVQLGQQSANPVDSHAKCDYCNALAEFVVSYYSK